MNSLFDVISAFNGGSQGTPQPVAPAPGTNTLFDVVSAFDGPPKAYQPNILPGGEQYQRTASTDKIVEGQPITRNYLMGQLLRPSESYMDGEGNVVGAGVQDVKNDEAARNMLVLMDRFGVDKLTDLPPQLVEQLPSKGKFEERSGGFWSSLGDFLTNPGVMMLLGAGWAAAAGAGAGAAGAASGASAAADLGTVAGAAGEFGAGGALGGYGQQLAASSALAGGAGAGSTASGLNNIMVADSGTTMTDVGPGLLESAAPEAVGAGEYGAGLSSELAWGAPEIATGEGNVAGALSATTGGLGTGVGSGVGGAIANGVPAAATGAYQLPYADILKGVLGSYLSSRQASSLRDIAGRAAGMSDPFASQRPQYQTQFSNLTTTPSNFFEDPAVSDIINFSQDATARKLASQGYNMSGNFANEVAKTGMREAFGQYMPYTQMIGNAAGAFQGTQGAGSAYGVPAAAAVQAQGDVYRGLGSIFESIYRGQQPTSGQRVGGVGGSNQSLMDYFLA